MQEMRAIQSLECTIEKQSTSKEKGSEERRAIMERQNFAKESGTAAVVFTAFCSHDKDYE